MDITEQIISEAIAEKMQPYIDEVNNGQGNKSWLDEFDFSVEEIEYAKSKIVNKSKCEDSYTWGIDCIDKKITTPKKGKVILLVSDENTGKSTFCYFFARKNYIKYDHKVVYFNLEQTKEEVINDMAIQYSGLSKIEIRDNTHFANDLYKKRKLELETQEDIVFIGRKATSTTSMVEIRKRIQDVPMDYLILDNLTCIEGRGANRNEEMKNITLELISLAQELDIPILLVHHYRKKSTKTSEVFRETHEIEGSGALKNLVPIIIQVARTTDPQSVQEENEFHIQEGKLRGGSRKEKITIEHHKGEFYEGEFGSAF